MTSRRRERRELSEDALRNLVEEYKALVRNRTGADFPMDPARAAVGRDRGRVEARGRSRRPSTTADVNNIPEYARHRRQRRRRWCSAISATTPEPASRSRAIRRPARRKFYGEFLVNAQGEDVVAGIRTPLRIERDGDAASRARTRSCSRRRTASSSTTATCRTSSSPSSAASSICCRRARGKRTAAAAVRIARDMVDGGSDHADARRCCACTPSSSTSCCIRSSIRARARSRSAIGLPASPGAASGIAVFDPDVAEQRAAAGMRVILVRDETTPEDFHGIVAARAVLTARGGMTSHAAVVARGMGKCAVVGCKDMHVDLEHRSFTVNGTT